MSDLELKKLRQEIVEHGPWHIDVEIAHGLTSAVGRDTIDPNRMNGTPSINFVNPRDGFVKTMHVLYPEGLEMRSFLDCACNCGAFCFWAKELGAGRTLGIDARSHWIRQARLIQRYRPFTQMDFSEMDLYDLPNSPMARFDITLFRNIFHLLPDPLRGLQIAAQLTREILILNTPVVNVTDAELFDGSLLLSPEETESAAQGIHHLNWYPTGPNVLLKMLSWLGFAEVKLHYYVKAVSLVGNGSPLRTQKKGDVQIIAARKSGLLDRLKTVSKIAGSETEAPVT